MDLQSAKGAKCNSLGQRPRPETLAKDAVFIQAKPSVQSISGGGGWANGDAVFVGPNPTDEAVITYYQKKRHIFGDLKIEVFDSKGKLLGAIPSSKRRGLNRATWAMRLKAPKVPRAASAALATLFFMKDVHPKRRWSGPMCWAGNWLMS